MASVYKYIHPDAQAFHAEKKRYRTEENQALAATLSTTVYVGNLSFVTSDVQVRELFSRCGRIKRVIMGINRVTMTPCGFCFVE